MNNYLPVMLLKGFVILPNQEVKLELNNDISEKVINLSSKHHNSDLLVVCPLNPLEETPEVNDLPTVGVIGHIKSRIELPNGNVRVIILGLDRVKINKYNNFADDKDILMADISAIKLAKNDIVEETALRRKLFDEVKTYINNNPDLSNSILNNIKDVDDLYLLTDLITSFIPFPLEKKLLYMQEASPIKRANALIYDLAIELEVLKLDERIDDALRKDLEDNQKEFILRSKLTEIKKELGEDDEHAQDVSSYADKINHLNAPEKTKNKLLQELKKFDYMGESSPESSIVRSYLDTVLGLPWAIFKEDNEDLSKVRNELDKTHYGLDKIKDRIIEYLAVKKRNPNLKSPIICLVGPPGVGKTSLGIGIAKALNKEFYKISVGGLNDPAELTGHRRTYLGSNPGKIIQALSKCGVANPVIIIDEIDKMGKDFRGDPAAALLDILDPEQNTMFMDNYVEEPFDLSKVMFILTANDISSIPPALIDRLEIIELSSYTEWEKLAIVKKYLLPKIVKDHLIAATDIKMNDNLLKYIINNYTKEAGVRELDRVLTTIIRKLVTSSVMQKTKLPIKLQTTDIIKLLGPVKYDLNISTKTITPGLVNGLAYTSLGGLVMPLECCLYDGTGKFITTGMLGQSMNESMQVALSYIRAHHELFKLSDYYFTNKDIHLHALEGAIPKDGPSAGVTITTSILSLILNKAIPTDLAMTGEITLRGDILEIGGLKEKLIGAYNTGIKKVFIPLTNERDLSEIPDFILNKLDIIKVSNYEEIFNYLFK
jgi:ATP-dependent Lon protease